MFRSCPRVSLVPPLQYARKDGGRRAEEPERQGEGEGNRRSMSTSPRRWRRVAGQAQREGEFSHQSADDGGAVEDVNRAIDPHLTSN